MKKLLLIVGILLMVAIGGFIWWKIFTSSPKYSLLQIKKAVENHDVDSFEKYVDIESITTRVMGELPNLLGAEKDMKLFGDEAAEIVMSLVKEPVVNMVKSSVQAFIERGTFDKTLTEKGVISKLLKQIPLDSLQFVKVKEIRKEGKICSVPLEVYVEAYDGKATVEFMMRDKGNYWQIAEIRNLSEFIQQIAELKKQYPYKNLLGATLYFANQYAPYIGELTQNFVKGKQIEEIKATIVRNFEMDNSTDKREWHETMGLGSVAKKIKAIAKSGQTEQAIEMANSTKFEQGEWDKSVVLGYIAQILSKSGQTEKAKQIFTQALKVARSALKEDIRSSTTDFVVEAMAESGQIEWAIETARTIEDKWTESCALAYIVNIMAESGQVERALEITNSISKKENWCYAEALGYTAQAMAKSGQIEQMEKFFTQAMQIAKIEDDKDEMYIKQGYNVMRSYLLKTMTQRRINALGYAVEALTKSGQVEQAIEIANSIKDTKQRAKAFAKIALYNLSLNLPPNQQAELANKIMTAYSEPSSYNSQQKTDKQSSNGGAASNEGAAISNLRTLGTVEAQYMNTYNAYTDLKGLFAAGLIDSKLASGTQQGYVYAITGTTNKYQFACTADPVDSSTGTRHFYIDQTGVIRFSKIGQATASSDPID